MDRLINERKRQLSEMKQILKMQGLLEEYDRENIFLNKQIDTLLKQNIKLKQQKTIQSFAASRVLPNEDYFSKGSKSRFTFYEQNKSNKLSQPRKSRYSYMYDESELKDLKSNLKNQIKKDTQKQISTKEVQTNTQYIPQFHSLQKTPTITSIDRHQHSQITKLNQSKSTFIKPFSHLKQTQLIQVQKTSPSRSKSKERQTSQKKLEVISKSRIYLQRKQESSNKLKQSNIEKNQNQNQSTNITKQFYLEKSEVLEHSFGYSPQQNLQKKVTLLQSDLPSGLRYSKNITDSRMTTKFLPLSIQSKQLSTNLPKAQQRSVFYNEPISRTQSKPKRKHSLNPSPKVEYQPSQLLSQKIQPFVLKTQEAISPALIQLHRNPSEQIKRKFIKIVSSKKISVEESPKRK